MTRNTETKVCELCDKSEYLRSVREAGTYRRRIIPERYGMLCSDCAEDVDEFDAREFEDAELIAGIISDSIGYASPIHAAKHVGKWRDGGTECWCERGGAVFDRDLNALIESAARHWLLKSTDERDRLLAKVARWQEIEDDDRIASMSISMMAPVGGF